MRMYCLYQCRYVLRRRKLGDAVPQIENVTRVLASAIALQQPSSFAGNLVGRGKKYGRVDVALQRHPVTDASARFPDVDCPVDADRIAADVSDRLQPCLLYTSRCV